MAHHVPAAGQSLGIIATAQAREGLSQEDALLAGTLAAQDVAGRVAFTFNQAAASARPTGVRRVILNPANLADFNAALDQSPADQQRLVAIEQAVAAGTPVSQAAAHPGRVAGADRHVADGEYFNGGVAVVNAMVAADHQISHAAWVRVAVVSGIGLLGLLVTILVTTLVGRGIIRRLGGLERSALALAENQLPDVIARLRRGEDVDVAAEAPPLPVGRDEIGRVGQAFQLVRQTAVGAAVDEARLRPRAQRRVPQPGPAQPVAAAPPAGAARPDGTAGHRPRGPGRPVPA